MVASSNVQIRYEVFGPFRVPRKPRRDGKLTLDFSRGALASFWEEVELDRPGLPAGVGCYLFAVRAAKGIRPWYVGQCKGAFEKECFASHKKDIYRDVMDDTMRGTPVLFLITRMTPTGRLSTSLREDEADFLERRLIHDATKANRQLKNVQNTRFVKSLVIPGVLNSPRGKQSSAVTSLKAALTRPGTANRQGPAAN